MLEDYWYIACRSSAINKAPVAFAAFDRPLVAFRNGEGRAGVLVDRCTHRNAPLSQGRIADGLLQCPYHGWSYDIDGSVKKIPACPADKHASRRLHIDSYPCVEQEGYLWFTLTDRPALETPPKFAFYGEPGWTTFRMDTLFDAPVETCLENFLDCPHAMFVHRYWFRKPTLKPVRAVVRYTQDGAEAEYFDEPREGSLVWTMLSRRKSTMRHIDRFIAPAISRVDYQFSDKRYYVITSACTPLNDTQTRVHTVISFQFGRIGWLIRCFFQPLSRWIIGQDVRVVALQQSNIEKFGEKRYTVLPQDLLYQRIIRWRAAIRDRRPTPVAGESENVDLRL